MKKIVNLVLIAILGVAISLFLNFYLTSKEASKEKISNLVLPTDFTIEKFADLSPIGKPRMMAKDKSGNIFVTIAEGYLVKLDKNAKITILAKNLNRPNGIDVIQNGIFIAETDQVVFLPYDGNKVGEIKQLIKNLPTTGHGRKSVKVSPDGYIFVNIGSSCNVCIEADSNRATILRFTLDGEAAGFNNTSSSLIERAIWARGLRNSQGFAWHPVTNAFYATNEGADNRSSVKGDTTDDDLPPEHLNIIEKGNNYGWPHCWADANNTLMFQDPNFPSKSNFCLKATTPAIKLPAHSTPIGITFLNESNFPSDYQNDAIIALHGSWNRKIPSGHQLLRVKFKNNKPYSVEPFISGWLEGSKAWGRPVDVLVNSSGSLLVSDDKNGLIYKVSYRP